MFFRVFNTCQNIQGEPQLVLNLCNGDVSAGMRLLAVDSSNWRVQLNVPLRKVHAASRGEGEMQHVLVLQLKTRKAAAATEALTGSSELRRLACHTEEAATGLHDQLQGALASLNARRRIWHGARGAGETYPAMEFAPRNPLLSPR